MDIKVLKLLKENKNSFISGQDLSRKLNVSRTAIWKHINNLRHCGYNISAAPHLGYCLESSPDKLLPDEISIGLKTKFFGSRIFAYNCVDSTNDIAYGLAEQKIKEGALIVAEAQTKGKGRLGRHWLSPSGYGIYMSLVIRPDIPPVEAGKLTLMASVAIAKTIRDITGLPAMIKWPNDVYINKSKVCGILTEMSAEVDAINFLIMGVGININTPKGKLPEIGTSLYAERGNKVNRVEFLQEMLLNLESYYLNLKNAKISDLISDWRDYSMTLGKRIKVDVRNKTVEGQAMDIDDLGALIVRDDLGFMHRILSGDARIIR
jgi:BirA family biotin operon repressor/biotin-[acetyl-CoA-carboxylase] ligase